MNAEETLRMKLHAEFEKCVEDAMKQKTGQDIIDDLIIKAHVGGFYQSLKEEQAFALMCEMMGLNYDEILDAECNKVLDKYLTIR